MRSLVEPTVEYEQDYRSYIQELGDTERHPFPLDFEFDDFPALIERLRDHSQGKGLPDGFVANSTFWLVEDHQIIGVSNLRHEMTETLKSIGGHIGLGVRPSAQGRGVGKELLRLTLQRAWAMDISKAYLVCLKDNIASARVIQANGGVLEAEYSIPKYSGIVQRYVIESTPVHL